MRRAVGRLQGGAHELGVIALVMPIFLAGMELAAEGFDAAGVVQRDASQRRLDRIAAVVYLLMLVLLALRARIGSGRAVRLLPALLSGLSEREPARTRLERLGGRRAVRHFADAVADHGWLLLILFAVLATTGWALGWAPNPIWLTIFVGTTVAIDVRWRALVADVSDQLPRD